MNGLQVRDSPAFLRRADVPVDPRILARMVSVRRDRRHHRWRWAAAVLAVLAAAAGGWAITRSPVLGVAQVEVHGASHTVRRAVLAAAVLDRRRQMLDLDLAAIARNVRAMPWVAQVDVRRDWPSTVTIAITERAPSARMGGAGGQPSVVDGQGRVLATGAEAAAILANQPGLPELQGVGAAGGAGTTLGPGAAPALALVQALTTGPEQGAAAGQPGGGTGRTALPGRLAAVVRAPDGALGARWLPGPVLVVFGSTDRLDSKVLVARSLLAQIAPGTAATIDVRVVDAPVLTNGANRTMVSTTQRG